MLLPASSAAPGAIGSSTSTAANMSTAASTWSGGEHRVGMSRFGCGREVGF